MLSDQRKNNFYISSQDRFQSFFSEVSSETVKTLMAYGYNLEPPTNEAGESGKC